MKTTQRTIQQMLDTMQRNDPNGSWTDAPLDRNTLEAMMVTLVSWSGEGAELSWMDALGMVIELEVMWDGVYTKLWDGIPITRLEYDLFLSQAGDVDTYMMDGMHHIHLENRDITIKWAISPLREAVNEMIAVVDEFNNDVLDALVDGDDELFEQLTSGSITITFEGSTIELPINADTTVSLIGFLSELED